MNKKEELLRMTLFGDDTSVFWSDPEEENDDWVDELDDDDDEEIDFSSDEE